MSRSSMGPSANTKSCPGSMLFVTRQATSEIFWTSTLWSTTMMAFTRLISPSPQRPCITLRPCPGYSFLMDTITKLWKEPSAGMFKSTISGRMSFIMGRKTRSVTLPIQ